MWRGGWGRDRRGRDIVKRGGAGRRAPAGVGTTHLRPATPVSLPCLTIFSAPVPATPPSTRCDVALTWTTCRCGLEVRRWVEGRGDTSEIGLAGSGIVFGDADDGEDVRLKK